jgi:ATP-dependent helicase YprA (DUF1998 family)
MSRMDTDHADPEDLAALRAAFDVADGGESALGWLDWVPAFAPYRHQAKAWERLSTLHGPARPTLITTGTGSGKTESFLVPVLDHCRRQKALGRGGVKTVLLYPMNALATDQAGRIGEYLAQPELAQVTAGCTSVTGRTPTSGG